MEIKMEDPFAPPILADDLCEVQRIYAEFFAGLDEADWDRPAKRGADEWNLRQTVAHLCALNGSGLEGILAGLRGETYTFEGLENRYQFDAFNRRGIEEHLSLPTQDLRVELLSILRRAADTARSLRPDQSQIATEMPIYNRPVKIVEGLSIIMFHAGLHHTAQVSEPAGVEPLWVHLAPEIRQRVIGRVMRALSLLYRYDLGRDLRAGIVFEVSGPGGGSWHVKVSPDSTDSGAGSLEDPRLTIRLRNTDYFCKMFTKRINLPLALLTGRMRLRGDMRLFTRFGSLFSVDARQ